MVFHIFENFSKQSGSHTEQIIAPKSGDIIIFWTEDMLKVKDWVHDGLAWKNQGGKKPLPPPPNEPMLFKTYFHLIMEDRVTNKNIIKDVYFMVDRLVPVVIHYLDKTKEGNVLLDYPPPLHGNTKNKENSEGFIRTLPSIFSQIKNNVTSKNAHIVYKETSKKNGPRDLKQCQNLRYAVNRLKRFTHDEVANCHLMHISLSFPNHILTVPDIRIIGIDNELLMETKKTLAAFDNQNRICFQYDTTFNLTGYYVSVLVYIHPILIKTDSDKSPTIPLAYFIHEKKHEKAHCEFWRYIVEILPELENIGYLVTDCEDAFRNAIKKYLPKIPLLRCWNHFYKSTERWIMST
ncbi:unnamed protein product [Brachionus calyciflorus]|uniref:MULE transposase domain-containing protein n=1 Tax=Brachionus calyciflorus TaxID=104777 RepID=A0A813W2R3_9BILA|nr:unnamed protein product [Brachionus calyciflorus]